MGQQISRREAIQILVAAAGAFHTALIPIDWSAPLVQAGVLPAHAQSSPETSTPYPGPEPTLPPYPPIDVQPPPPPIETRPP
jgi:hypothetical protein